MESYPKVNRFVENVLKGAGWATPEYIQEHNCMDFDQNDQFQIMLNLAEQGRLYEENKEAKEAASNGKFPPAENKLSVEYVQRHYRPKATQYFNNINDLPEEQKPFTIVDHFGNLIAKFFHTDHTVNYLLARPNRYLKTSYGNGKYDLWSVTNIYGGLKHEL